MALTTCATRAKAWLDGVVKRQMSGRILFFVSLVFARLGYDIAVYRTARYYLLGTAIDVNKLQVLFNALQPAGGATHSNPKFPRRHSHGRSPAASEIAPISRAVARRRGSAAKWYRLGRAFLTAPGVDAVHVQGVGLVPRKVGIPRLAADAFRQAVAKDPARTKYRDALALALLAQGEAAEAATHLAEIVSAGAARPRTYYRLGMAILKSGAHGSLAPDERQAAVSHFQKALSLDSTHDGVRRRVIRSAIEDARWSDAWAAAVRDGLPSADAKIAQKIDGLMRQNSLPEVEILQLLTSLDHESHIFEIQEWWLPLHCRLISENKFVEAFGLKNLAARQVSEKPWSLSNILQALDGVRAANYLGKSAEAERRAAAILDQDALPELSRRRAEKLLADLRFINGNTPTTAEQRPRSDAANASESVNLFAELIEGRNVAIVGPATRDLRTGPEIDAYDTVIRTTHFCPAGDEAQYFGQRTDIAYYAGSSSGSLALEIPTALRDGKIKQAVFRPSTFQPNVLWLNQPGDLRYVPSEYSAGFRGGPMAIQRIAYDVLPYRPQRVKLFCADLFAGSDTYSSYGPRIQGRSRWAALGEDAARALHHDYLLDLFFTQQLLKQRLIETDAILLEVLSLTPAEYLLRLEERRGS